MMPRRDDDDDCHDDDCHDDNWEEEDDDDGDDDDGGGGDGGDGNSIICVFPIFCFINCQSVMAARPMW